MKVNIKTWDKQ